ncbi:MAG: hypothetical protein IH855_03985 [Bacteroidetes bacterium]|nr:hypothetical protein [Bacteroidota bacterium]
MTRKTIINVNDLFEQWWMKAHAEAEEVLGPLAGLTTITDPGTVLGDAIQRARNLYGNGDEQGVAELGQVLNLLSSLKMIKEARPTSFAAYRSRLLGAPSNTGAFMGVRAEVSLEVMLLDCGFRFEKSEHPDFWISGYSEPIAVECTSARIYSSAVSLGEKIAATVRNKEKSYRAEKWHIEGPSILFVDVTSLKKSLHGLRMDSDPLPDMIDQGTLTAIQETHFDYVFVTHEVHVLGLDNSAMQGRFINNTSPSSASETLMLDIERAWDKRKDLKVLLSPDL